MKHGNLEVLQIEDGKALHDIWPRIREGFLIIKSKCDGIYHLPEDIYMEIKTGALKLLVASINGEYEGFSLVNIHNVPDGKCMHIWGLHHAGNDPDFLRNISTILDQLAEYAGANRISLISSRAGWFKHERSHGYRLTGTLSFFEKEV